MNGILGFSSLLSEPGLSNEEQQEYIKLIQISGARMLNLISEIIDISKIESGMMEVKLEEVDVNREKISFLMF
jgi:signal transduction histidine kinase